MHVLKIALLAAGMTSALGLVAQTTEAQPPMGQMQPTELPAPDTAAAPPPVELAPEAAPAPSAARTDPEPGLVLLKNGMASWYGPRFHGRRTASGERYNMHELTAAHKYLPFGTKVKVRSVHTGQSVVVRINDRGPYKHQRVLDLSRAAMDALGALDRGVTQVEVWVETHQLETFQRLTERWNQRATVRPQKQHTGKLPPRAAAPSR